MKFVLSMLLLLAPFRSFAESFSDHAAVLSSSYELEGQKKYKEAIEALVKAVKKAPDSYILNYRMGFLYAVSGLTANASEHFNAALKAEPQSIEALVGLLNIEVAKSNWAGVEALTEKMLVVDPYNYIAGWNKIKAFIMLGKFDEGLALANKFLKVYPSDQTLLVQKGMCLGYAKKNAEAIAAYKNVQAVYPLDPTASAALKLLK